jgi:hypothetical protein
VLTNSFQIRPAEAESLADPCGLAYPNALCRQLRFHTVEYCGGALENRAMLGEGVTSMEPKTQ